MIRCFNSEDYTKLERVFFSFNFDQGNQNFSQKNNLDFFKENEDLKIERKEHYLYKIKNDLQNETKEEYLFKIKNDLQKEKKEEHLFKIENVEKKEEYLFKTKNDLQSETKEENLLEIENNLQSVKKEEKLIKKKTFQDLKNKNSLFDNIFKDKILYDKKFNQENLTGFNFESEKEKKKNIKHKKIFQDPINFVKKNERAKVLERLRLLKISLGNFKNEKDKNEKTKFVINTLCLTLEEFSTSLK